MAPKKQDQPDELMIVNDAPGEECRIAITENGHLEELFSERTANATNVGNIYKGRVINVEPAIQAAFIDYGEGANGFLHISDLHPRYFPGAERKERVGKKIPRRDRPLMQEALRRGDEVLVQVLKEGIGTKGPTLTSYLSIPGRLLVAMPEMDRVGVSRKVEDEEKRRKMRQILDSLDLPEGFGFILRTAGFDRTKAELKRDVAYLMRLWKTMEQRRKSTKGACELYTESDLLIRTIRDVLRPSINAIIVDSESAYHRATNFLGIAAPRSAPKVIRYHRSSPIFHAFDIERQIDLIHSREVPLSSGGQLVIEQTEALVAIDVNSGKSRSARDSESNAYQTNCEAVDEICRQLRLRDLGGLIINDLIDMRSRKNRRAIEERFQHNLKRDRARTMMLRISDFGLVELTRQRMRPSLRKSHFIPCSHCNGYGEIRSPESVGADSIRQIGYLLQFDRVKRIEIVCSPRVASVMLSGKRRQLVRLEDDTEKRVDVRVSDAIALDRVDFYAYDDRNADIDISQLMPPKIPTMKEMESEAREAAKTAEKSKPAAEASEADRAAERDSQPSSKKKKKSGSRGKRGRKSADATPDETSDTQAPALGDEADQAAEQDSELPKKKRRRSRRGGRRHRKRREAQAAAESASAGEGEVVAEPAGDAPVEAPAPTTDRKKSTSKKKIRSRQQSEAKASQDSRGTLRVHELAKQLNVPSREVLNKCEQSPHISVKNHMSSISADVADQIRQWFETDSEETVPGTQRSSKQQDASGKAASKQRPPRRRGKKASKDSTPTGPERASEDTSATNAEQPEMTDEKAGERRGRSRRRRGGKKRSKRTASQAAATDESTPSGGADTNGSPTASTSSSSTASESSGESGTKTSKPRRRLYRNRSTVSPTAREEAERVLD